MPTPLLLILVAALAGQLGRPGREAVLTATVGGVLIVAVPFAAMAVGKQLIPSGLGGCSMPPCRSLR